jgi:hypothetical protein
MKNTLPLTAITIAVSALNLIAIGYLCDHVMGMPSDKSMAVFVFYYPLLLMANTVAWFLLKVFDYPLVRPMKYIVIVLLALLFPLAWIIGSV